MCRGYRGLCSNWFHKGFPVGLYPLSSGLEVRARISRFGIFRENAQQINQQFPFRRKAEGFTGVHVFKRGTPAGLGFAALEANEISMVRFIHVHSIRIERHMIVT
jgi:hypothetical protein